MSKTPINSPLYWVAWNALPNIGPVRIQEILKYFSSLEEAWHAPLSLLLEKGCSEKMAQHIVQARNTINPEQEIENITKAGLSIVTLADEAYPKLLKEIYAPPPVLFYRGILPQHNQHLLAVVGSRKHSAYGKQVTNTLVHDIATQRVVIVSGLALGIDAYAHHATLEAGGTTIAVLGSSVEPAYIYPRTNQHLAEKIIEHNGCVLSEHPPGTQALKQHFPRRNRIIAGLCFGTLIIEAAETSGALITAQHALEYNREVCAVPGSIFHETSTGTNNLIHMGARVVTKAHDVCALLNIQMSHTKPKEHTPETPQEAQLFPHITQTPIHINELARLTKMPIQDINATLALMEMKGMITHLGSMNYVIT